MNNVDVDKEAPSQPNGLHATKVTSNSAELTWNSSTDNVGVKEYQVLRDGKAIGTIPGTTFTDKNLKANTKYTYTVKAVDAAGNVSKESESAVIETMNTVPDTEAPTQPTALHTMGVTSSSVDLMWSASEDNVAVDHYVLYRGTPVGQMTVVGTSKLHLLWT